LIGIVNLQNVYILVASARRSAHIIALVELYDRTSTSLTDELLVDSIRKSCDARERNDLYQELFGRYRSRVTDWCFRIVKDSDRSADLAQEVFLRAFQRLDTYRRDARLSTWLYTIARNHCFNAIKRRSIAPGANESMLAELPGSDGTEVYSAVERMDSFKNLWLLMRNTLTPLEIRVVALHYAHDIPLAEITRRLVLSNPSGAKAYIVNARRKLSAALREQRPKAGVSYSRTDSGNAGHAAC